MPCTLQQPCWVRPGKVLPPSSLGAPCATSKPRCSLLQYSTIQAWQWAVQLQDGTLSQPQNVSAHATSAPLPLDTHQSDLTSTIPA